MIICETDRLLIRHCTLDDAGFIIKLLNEPAFIENIADKGVRTVEDAIKYLQDGPIASYENFGFGLNIVERKDSATPIGMCGLIKRDELDDVDIGYSLLTEYAGKGYAREAAIVVLKNGNEVHGLKRIIAVTSLTNESSIGLLKKLGFEYESMVELYGMDNKLFGVEF